MFGTKHSSWKTAAAGLGFLGVLGLAASASATTYSDRAAAALIWPKVVVDAMDFDGDQVFQDTVIRVVNDEEGDGAILLHCFYVNANSHCTNTGQVCLDSADCADGAGSFGSCQPDWLVTDFAVRVSPGQPLVWSAADGLSDFPLPIPGAGPVCDSIPIPCTDDAFCVNQGAGTDCVGDERSNAGSRVPPVPETPFIGELKCVQVDPATGLPRVCDAASGSCDQDLQGDATIQSVDVESSDGIVTDAKTYNAIGVRVQPNGQIAMSDGELVLDPDPAGEFQPCPGVLVFNHFFDGATDPVTQQPYSSELTLVPCTQNFDGTGNPLVTAQFLVYNEFEQRFSTSRQVSCLLDSPISEIDTTQPNRSIFNAAVAGTIAGQTRITGVGGGLLGVAVVDLTTSVGGDTFDTGAAYNLNQFGDRSSSDTITIPE